MVAVGAMAIRANVLEHAAALLDIGSSIVLLKLEPMEDARWSLEQDGRPHQHHNQATEPPSLT
jgi:hypothetical protein